jgi:hypothetical protein
VGTHKSAFVERIGFFSKLICGDLAGEPDCGSNDASRRPRSCVAETLRLRIHGPRVIIVHQGRAAAASAPLRPSDGRGNHGGCVGVVGRSCSGIAERSVSDPSVTCAAGRCAASLF